MKNGAGTCIVNAERHPDDWLIALEKVGRKRSGCGWNGEWLMNIVKRRIWNVGWQQ